MPIGGGLSYTVKQWIDPVTDEQVAGLSSLLDYLNTNYRRIYDDSCITNNYYITTTITPYTEAILLTTTNTITLPRYIGIKTYTHKILLITKRNNMYYAKTFMKRISNVIRLITTRKLKTSILL